MRVSSRSHVNTKIAHYYLRAILILVLPSAFLVWFWYNSSPEQRVIAYSGLVFFVLVYVAWALIKSYSNKRSKRSVGFLALFFIVCFYFVVFYLSDHPVIRELLYYTTFLSYVFGEFFLDKYYPLSDESQG